MRRISVTVATPLERELAARIAALDPRVAVNHQPDLLPPPRYPCDHRGEEGWRRDRAGQRRFEQLVASSEVLFGIPDDTPDGLAWAVRLAPSLRWVAATAAGAGQQVIAARLTPAELDRVTVTRASGPHAGPLAEFTFMALLAFTRGLSTLQQDKAARRWSHYPVAELRSRVLVVLGTGAIGQEILRLGRAFGMHSIGVRRRARSGEVPADEVCTTAELHPVLARADAVVSTLPATRQTRHLLDADALARLKRGAILVNVGRGAVVDERALVSALRTGHLLGAALDVFEHEPLPPDDPLWELDNVIISPHTAALSERENERLVAAFCDNLRRYLAGEPLQHVVDVESGY
jgi:phosphoglycerate dehydrogenase-like enzyme